MHGTATHLLSSAETVTSSSASTSPSPRETGPLTLLDNASARLDLFKRFSESFRSRFRSLCVSTKAHACREHFKNKMGGGRTRLLLAVVILPLATWGRRRLYYVKLLQVLRIIVLVFFFGEVVVREHIL